MKRSLGTLLFLFLIICCSFVFGKEAKTKDMEVYLEDLMSSRTRINANNYQQIVYQKVCPYMRALQNIEPIQKNNKKTRQHILQEVVKIYDKAFDFSGDHHLMYCVYNYYSATKSKNPIEFFKIAQKIVSPEKLRILKDRWKTCDKEEKKGNGGGANILFKKQSSYLIPKEQYKQMSSSLRLSYIKKIKKAFLHFEMNIRNKRKQKKKTAWFNFLNFFIKPAFAQSTRTCLIGGKIRNKIFSSRRNKYVCPVRGNSCGGSESNFKCGFVFNNKCIPIKPVRSLSERCYKASENEPINPRDYEMYQSEIDNTINNFCDGQNRGNDGCRNFLNRIKSLPSTEAETPLIGRAIETTNPGPKDIETEAGATCLSDCPIEQEPSVKALGESIEVATLKNSPMMQYFLDTIQDNASCRCKVDVNNDGVLNNSDDRDPNLPCRRGCLLPDKIEDNPPQILCKGTKSVGTSEGDCARHVIGAIMTTIHKYLAIYCNKKDLNTSEAEYKQCTEKMYTNRSICKNRFVFPSALCALNLDGQSEQDFDEIVAGETTKVKERKDAQTNCKNANTGYNNDLYTFSIGNPPKKVPFFKKIDPSEYEGYHNNPQSIPKGAIVVMKSESVHGHIEIKTDQNQFCSDYCQARDPSEFQKNPKDGKRSKEIQAVFEWNPEILKYATL